MDNKNNKETMTEGYYTETYITEWEDKDNADEAVNPRRHYAR